MRKDVLKSIGKLVGVNVPEPARNSARDTDRWVIRESRCTHRYCTCESTTSFVRRKISLHK